ncbi:hypothetical protein [Usitatibacter rugosus]|uniref:hypothetical protein n=1 Tax=Usitatibacter rugosus TaxID=2732067 RepID=UPI001487E451|nr:hypothetical protein [Usitatibacter rugosus]
MRAPKAAVATLMIASILAAPTAVLADTPQSLSAKIGGKPFESDDDGILYLMPTKSTLNLMAATKGASAYPPPKTPIDRLAIMCKNFDAKPVKYAAKDFGGHGCEVKFVQGVSKTPMGEPQAEYRIAPGNNVLEITSVKGKVIEGKFAFELVEVKTKAKLSITDGTFKAEDRQK